MTMLRPVVTIDVTDACGVERWLLLTIVRGRPWSLEQFEPHRAAVRVQGDVRDVAAVGRDHRRLRVTVAGQARDLLLLDRGGLRSCEKDERQHRQRAEQREQQHPAAADARAERPGGEDRRRARTALAVPLAQVRGHVADGLIARLAILGQAALDDALQLRRRGRRELSERGRILVKDLVQRVDERLGLERPRVRNGLVQDAAEREDVGARVERLAGDLLGGHVPRRAEKLAVRGEGAEGGGVGADRIPRGVGQLGQAEVDDLRVAVLGDQDVVGLEIAVNDPGAVRFAESVRDLGQDFDRAAERETVLQRLAQRLALDQLHGDVVHFGPALRALADRLYVHDRLGVSDLVNADDVRVAESRGRARFVGEAADALPVAGQIGREDFEGNVAAQRAVVGAVDVAHRAGADEGDDLVAGDAGSGLEGLTASRVGGCCFVGLTLPLHGRHGTSSRSFAAGPFGRVYA
jgi:hypothetical protein